MLGRLHLALGNMVGVIEADGEYLSWALHWSEQPKSREGITFACRHDRLDLPSVGFPTHDQVNHRSRLICSHDAVVDKSACLRHAAEIERHKFHWLVPAIVG